MSRMESSSGNGTNFSRSSIFSVDNILNGKAESDPSGWSC